MNQANENWYMLLIFDKSATTKYNKDALFDTGENTSLDFCINCDV